MANEAYLSLFKEESEEHLQMMNQNLLALEKNPNDIAVLNEIFRNAHTLKGMAATMNFQKITELSHNMENLMDALRSEQLQVEQGIIDTLFSCFDALEILVEEAVTGESKDVEISQLVASINYFTSGEGAPVAKPEAPGESPEQQSPGELLSAEEKENARKALQDGYILCFIKVTLDEGCLLKAARAYMVFRNLEEAGKIIKSLPSREEIEDEKFELDFSLFFATSEKVEEIQKSVENISEINRVDITSLSSSDLETDAAASQPAAASEAKPAEPPPDKVSGTDKAPQPAGEKVVKKKEVKEEKTQIVHTVRVDIKRLDALMNLVGELVISRTQLVQVAEDHMQKELSSTLAQVGRVVSDLQDLVMKVRMVPIEQVFNRFPRMVRDLTKTVKKKINLEISGEETEIDRTVVDEIGDPLVHILRNSIDHGIELPEIRKKRNKPETGVISLSASHEGDRIVIKVVDDGAGIDGDVIAQKGVEKGLVAASDVARMSDSEKINLLFLPGLSTAKEISDISGRGVGMDVVRSKIMSLRGTVELNSELGVGSSIVIKLPLTLAIIEALMISLAEEIYAVPLGVIDETVTIVPDDITLVKDREVILLRGEVLPLVRLREVYGIMGKGNAGEEKVDGESSMSVVVIHQGNKRMGLVVDSLIGQQEIVIKSLGALLNNIPGIAGATILGDGRVALIIDITALE